MDTESDRLTEWLIRTALFALAIGAIWTVFGDEMAALLGR